MSDFDKKLDKLLELKQGWDSYGANPVDRDVAERVREFLKKHPASGPRARIVPCGDGGIQLEWSHGDKELEIEFNIDGSTTYLQCGTIERPGQDVSLMQWVSVI